MQQERMEILRMVAEKIITAEEGERLLRALDEGARYRQGETQARQSFSRGLGSILDSVGEAMAGIGPAIRSAVEEATSEISTPGVDLGDLDEDDLENVAAYAEGFPLPAGTRVFVVSDRLTGAPEPALVIEGAEGDTCTVTGPGARQVRVKKGASACVIRWSGGPLTVRVPSTAASVRGRAFGGPITVSNVRCDVDVKTMGGNLVLHGVGANASARTMGGNVAATLESSFQGKAEFRTHGGNVTLSIPKGARGRIDAVTLGGRLEIAEDLGQVQRGQSFPKNQASVTVGDGETDSVITIKTMGGEITLRHADAHP